VGGFFYDKSQSGDIPERFSVINKGVRLLEMGAVDLGGSGCICPESAMLKTFLPICFFVRMKY
jgi:CO dehydrogenase maturation factor